MVLTLVQGDHNGQTVCGNVFSTIFTGFAINDHSPSQSTPRRHSPRNSSQDLYLHTYYVHGSALSSCRVHKLHCHRHCNSTTRYKLSYNCFTIIATNASFISIQHSTMCGLIHYFTTNTKQRTIGQLKVLACSQLHSVDNCDISSLDKIYISQQSYYETTRLCFVHSLPADHIHQSHHPSLFQFILTHPYHKSFLTYTPFSSVRTAFTAKLGLELLC